MEPEARPTLGERLSRRLSARENRRPRIGFTPSFYARLGLDDPWANGSEGAAAPQEGDGFVFLSAQPYYAMMRRLAAARRRRERRMAAFHERRAGTRLRAAQRSWPGEAPLATSRLARIALEDAVLPPPIPAAAPVDATPTPDAAPPARWTRRNTPTPAIRGAWLAREHVPARVVRGGDVARADVSSGPAAMSAPVTHASPASRASGDRPASRALEHAGARAAAVLETPAVRALREAAALPLAGGARLRRVVEQLDAAPPEEHVVIVRRALRTAGTVTRQLVDVPALAREASAAPRTGEPAEPRVRRAESTATERASRRMTADPGASLGLRPVLGRSPAMALAASAETDRASSGTLAEAAHADGERIPVRAGARPVRASAPVAGAAARVATRERASAPRPASVLPVAVPRPVPARAARKPRPHAGEASPATPAPLRDAIELARPPAVATDARRPASAHALARAVVAETPVAPPRAATRLADGTARSAYDGTSAGATSSFAPALAGAPTPAPTALERSVRTARRAAIETVSLEPGMPADASAPIDAPTLTQRAFARSQPAPTASLVPVPVARTAERPVTTEVARADARASRAERLTASAAEGERTPPTTRAPRLAAPEQRTAIPAAAVTAPADTAAETGMPPRTAARPAAIRRPPTRAAVNAAQRADAPRATAVVPVETATVPSRTPTGPLRYARGPTSRDLLGSAGSTRAPARTAASVTLLAQAEAGTATVSAEAVVRLADAPSAPFVTAREARRRGLQVVATERGLVAAARAQDVTREGTRVERAAPRGMPREGRAPRSTGAPDVRYVVPVDVVDVAAPERTSPLDAPVAREARPLRTRALARAMARQDVGNATAYRGALRDSRTRTAEPPTLAISNATDTAAVATQAESGAPARRSVTPGEARASGGRLTRGGTRTQRGAGVTPATLAAPLAVPPQPTGTSTDGGVDIPARSVAEPARRTRAPLEERLAQVSAGRTDGATGWVDRAEGSPRLSTVSGLIRALARASSNEDVVRVIAARGDLPTDAARLPLDAPAVQVIQQIREEVREELRTEVVQVAATETRASRLTAPEATALSPRALGSTAGPEATRRRVRSSALRSAEATARKANGGEDRLSKLVRRLQDLIHLAEDQNRRAEAQSQVRMAEDTAQARAEAQATSESRSPAAHKVDVDALGREVLDIVTKELELRRARRMEDSDESPWW